MADPPVHDPTPQVVGLIYQATKPQIPGDWTDPISCLICGAMIWVPFVSAFMAITFGWIAFRQPRTRTHIIVTVIGLLLSAVNFGIWCAFLGFKFL